MYNYGGSFGGRGGCGSYYDNFINVLNLFRENPYYTVINQKKEEFNYG